MLRPSQTALFLFAAFISASAAFAQTGDAGESQAAFSSGPATKVFFDADARFEAVMHGKPEHNVMKIGDGQDDVQHQYLVGASNGVYMVAYQDHPDLNGDDPEVLDEIFTSALQGFQKGIGGGQLGARTIALAGLKGRETRFRIPANQGAAITRMFFVNHRWYHVFVMGTSEFVNSEASQQFLDSFRVTDSETAKKSSRENVIQKLKEF